MKHLTVAPLMFAAAETAATKTAEQPKGQPAVAVVSDSTDTLIKKLFDSCANPYDALFTRVIFKASNGKQYGGGADGPKNKKIATVLIELMGGLGYLNGQMKAVEVAGKTKPNIEFGWIGNKAVRSAFEQPETAGRIRQYEEWRKGIKVQFKTWHNANPVGATASDDDVEIDGITLS